MKNDRPTLLILGSEEDPHVLRVASLIRDEKIINVFVMDYHNDTKFSLEVDKYGAYQLWINGSPLPNTYLVWDRVKILPGTELYIKGDEINSGYAAQEWRAFYTLLCGLNPGNVVNSLESRRCLIKPFQQILAARVGFLVPPTLVSNNKEKVVDFFTENNKKLIMKSLSAGKVKPAGEGEYIPYNVMTMRVEPSDLATAEPAEIAYCPHFFQTEIEKSHELRVVVVDDQILAFQINSQAHKISEVDWRKGIDYVSYTACEIDSSLSRKIIDFMQAIGFFCGSLDLIVDMSDQAWFLECNQAGAWGWLDDIADGAITRAYVDGFTRRLTTTLSESSYHSMN